MFRFNRRTSRSRGLVFYRVLELAVSHQPVRYRDLIIEPTPKKNPPTGLAVEATHGAWNAHRRTGPGEPPDLGHSG